MGGYGGYRRDELEEFNVAQLLEDNRSLAADNSRLLAENARLRAALDAIERAVKGVVRQ